jgi:hypothetical protein
MKTNKKLLIISLIYLFIQNIYCQQIDSCGIENNSTLSKYESEYFNNIFKNQRDTFDFTNKRIAFVTGSTGYTIGNKISYFNSAKEWQQKYGRTISTNMIVINKNENLKSNDYDAIITYWVKIMITERHLEKIIEKLKTSR